MRNTLHTFLAVLLGALAAILPAPRAHAEGPTFYIELQALVEGAPFTGRITIYLRGDGARVDKRLSPADAPYFDDPQPMYSMFVKDIQPGDQFKFVDELSFPAPLKDLPPGRYMVQAVLDVSDKHSSWRQEEGNLAAPTRIFIHDPANPPVVQLPLLNNYPAPVIDTPLWRQVEVESSVLSEFYGQPTTIRAGVALPVNYDENRKYPAIYWIPGAVSNSTEQGGDHLDAHGVAFRNNYRMRSNQQDQVDKLWFNTFLIAIDVMTPYGHNMAVNSDVHGPFATAIVNELIPELERQFSLVQEPRARIVQGQSSGGWSAIWLAMQHPDVFGAAWSTAPDPVDFRAFQLMNLYEDKNAFTDAQGKEVPSYRADGQPRMTVRQEVAMERVMNPDFRSGQQWGSWFAAFGPAKDGKPVPLFDPLTGKIDPQVADHWKRYDIGALIRSNPQKYGPIFRDNIRISVGTADNYWLHNAVKLLREDLARLGYSGGAGYIAIVDGADHGAFMSDAGRAILNKNILDYLYSVGLAQ